MFLNELLLIKYTIIVGIPSMYDKDNKLRKGFHWFKEFKKFCYVHVSAFHGDLTMFNDRYTYNLRQDKVHANCYKNAYIVDLSKDSSVYNIIIRLTGWGGDAFSHFNIYIIPQFAVVYQLLKDIHLQTYQSNSNDKYNITILSHTGKKGTIMYYFFNELFMNDPLYISMMKNKHIIGIHIINNNGWCARTPFTYFSSFYISPVFAVDINDKYKREPFYWINVENELYPRNLMAPINHMLSNTNHKPNLILYLSRKGQGRREVSNRDEVLKCLQNWVDNDLNSKQKDIEYGFIHYTNYAGVNKFNDVKDFFSKAILIIGPHGGKFGNIVFLQTGTFVIEFNDWENCNKEYELYQKTDKLTKNQKCVRTAFYGMSQAKGLHYYYLSPKNFDYNTHQKMIININDLNRILNDISLKILSKPGDLS